MKRLHLDFETYCEADLKKTGVYRYATDPSCEVLMAAYCLNDGMVRHWDATSEPMPKMLKDRLEQEDWTIVAYNAPFERIILREVLGFDIPVERFYCTMIHAYGLSFVGTLADVGEQIGVAQDKTKLKTGQKLIHHFCKPQPKNHKIRRWTRENDPEGWTEFRQYNIQDVVAEREIFHWLQDHPIRLEEWNTWFLDQKINDRGLPLDLIFIEQAIALANQEKHDILESMAEITKLENPNSVPQLRSWLHEQGYDFPNLQATTVEEALSGKIRKPRVRKILEYKKQISKSSISKYETMQRVAVEGRAHGTLQYMGAQRTARWAGRLIQPQNFMRPEKGANSDAIIESILEGHKPENTLPALANALRGAICAPAKRVLQISDLSGIEGRVLPWLCHFDLKLELIAGGRDMYLEAASHIYGIPYDQLNDDSWQRTPGKVAELSLGYQGALNALNKMAGAYGLPPYDEAEGYAIVRGWRSANKPIVDFWYGTERAARLALGVPDKLFASERIAFIYENDFLRMVLPSGREISYHKPEIDEDGLSYMGWNSFTRKWERIETYGGKLVENATQAVARDILAENMLLIEEAGYPIVGTVHDEIIAETSDSSRFSHVELSELLTHNPAWAEGLPLNAKGYTSRRYRKD